MSLEKHDLVHELPEYRDEIHRLKLNDHHFARLFNEYHELDHAVHRFEQGVENCDDQHLETLKKQRLALKDALFTQIKQRASN
jgi:uncharacterized protein YdcH (DUF465 family)